MFEYDELASKAASLLDLCDFRDEVESCRSLRILDAYDVREYISSRFLWDVREALDNLSLDEFMEYMNSRYSVRWQEVSHYEMY